jgi:hypothetical protein
MNKVKDLIAKQKFSKNVFALAQDYSNWETDEVGSKDQLCLKVTIYNCGINLNGSLFCNFSVSKNSYHFILIFNYFQV